MDAQPLRLLSYGEVLDRTGLSRTQVSKLVKKDRFPTPVDLEGRRVAFVEAEVESWIEQRVAHRASPAARKARAERSEHFRAIVKKRWSKPRAAATAGS